jgi:threonyl-tRNA synthetase
MRRVMEEYSRQRHEVSGYEFVYSPHISKAELFETSGTWTGSPSRCTHPWNSTGSAVLPQADELPVPHLIYKSRPRSYRELPLRSSSSARSTATRLSGVVQGLTRVRGMTQDDAHIFCTREQMGEEIDARRCKFVLDLLRDFGLNDFYLELSTRPSGQGGRDRRGVGRGRGDAGEAVARGRPRTWCSTPAAVPSTDRRSRCRRATPSVARTRSRPSNWTSRQPKRSTPPTSRPDNTRPRPIMIHRALFGSVERFMAILIEHYAGNCRPGSAPNRSGCSGCATTHDDLRLRRRRDCCAPKVFASVSNRRVNHWARGSARPSSKRSPTSSWSATRTSKGHGRDQRARFERRPSAACRWRTFSARLREEIAAHASPEAPAWR